MEKEPDKPEGLVDVGLMIDTVEGLRFGHQSHSIIVRMILNNLECCLRSYPILFDLFLK